MLSDAPPLPEKRQMLPLPDKRQILPVPDAR